MPVHCRKRNGKYRLVEPDNSLAETENGEPRDGGGHDSRVACEEQAAAINRNLTQNSLHILASPDPSAIRRETFQGTEHLVVPMVALVEGVVWPSNAPQPELALASEFGKYSGKPFDGRPVILDHPKLNGNPVPANIPEIQSQVFGQLFNSSMDGKKLKTEAWINLSTVQQLGGEVQQTVERLEAGELVEVSVGIFSQIEQLSGEFQGKEFQGVWRDVVPDHLALLPEGMKGACSAEMGCGAPRVNSANSSCNCPCGGACMTTNQQDSPQTPDAVNVKYHDGTVKVFAEGKDAQSAQNVHEVDMSDLETLDAAKDFGGRYLRALGNMQTEEKPEPTTRTNSEHDELGFFKRVLRSFGLRDASFNDRDTRMALQTALEMEDDARFADVMAIIPSSNDDSGSSGEFVFATFKGLFRRSFSISEDGTINLGAESRPVVPKTTFPEVKLAATDNPDDNEERRDMSVKEKVDSLIANSATHFDDNDRSWLSELSEDKLDKLVPAEAEESQGEQRQNSNGEQHKQPQTVEEFLTNSGMPKELADQLREGANLRQQKYDQLVKQLAEHPSAQFSENELRDMDLGTLERIAKMSGNTVYTGAGGAISGFSASGGESRNNAAPEPPKVFERKTQTN